MSKRRLSVSRIDADPDSEVVSFSSRNSLEGVIADLEFRWQSFVIKVWVDDPDMEGEKRVWHGRITHVPTGEGRSVSELREITSFIAVYLQQMGARTEEQRTTHTWLRWLKRGHRQRSRTEGKGQ